jgi:hypothetical protein
MATLYTNYISSLIKKKAYKLELKLQVLFLISILASKESWEPQEIIVNRMIQIKT